MTLVGGRYAALTGQAPGAETPCFDYVTNASCVSRWDKFPPGTLALTLLARVGRRLLLSVTARAPIAATMAETYFPQVPGSLLGVFVNLAVRVTAEIWERPACCSVYSTR